MLQDLNPSWIEAIIYKYKNCFLTPEYFVQSHDSYSSVESMCKTGLNSATVWIDIWVSAHRDCTVASSRDQIQFDLFTGISSN